MRPPSPLVIIVYLYMYACESWNLTAELEKRTQAFERRCYRSLLNIAYKNHITNEDVRRKIQAATGDYDELLTMMKKRKLRLFGHGSRRRGRQKKLEDNIKRWIGVEFASSARAAKTRTRWKGIVAKSSVVPQRLSKVVG